VSRPRRLWTRGIISVILWITFLLLISSVVQRLLTPNDAFTTTDLFDLTVPQTVGGFYQVNLSDRVASNMGMGDVLSVAVLKLLARSSMLRTSKPGRALSGPWFQELDEFLFRDREAYGERTDQAPKFISRDYEEPSPFTRVLGPLPFFSGFKVLG
jgi:hypothetical protein